MIGTEGERASTIRHGCRALAAVYQARVPWCSVILRRVFGVGGAAHSNHTRVSYRAAWPSGDWGSLPLEGGIEAAFRVELEQSEDPVALRAQIDEQMNAIRSPFNTAARFGIEEIIDPRETRPVSVRLRQPRRPAPSPRRHHLELPRLKPARSARADGPDRAGTNVQIEFLTFPMDLVGFRA